MKVREKSLDSMTLKDWSDFCHELSKKKYPGTTGEKVDPDTLKEYEGIVDDFYLGLSFTLLYTHLYNTNEKFLKFIEYTRLHLDSIRINNEEQENLLIEKQKQIIKDRVIKLADKAPLWVAVNYPNIWAELIGKTVI
jgi:hypothetical protein